MNVVESADTELPFSFVFVPKNNGSLRFYVNYRKVNVMTEHNTSAIPWMDECINSLRDALLFSTQIILVSKHAIQTLQCILSTPSTTAIIFQPVKW